MKPASPFMNRDLKGNDIKQWIMKQQEEPGRKQG
jgi:hypothetical protein